MTLMCSLRDPCIQLTHTYVPRSRSLWKVLDWTRREFLPSDFVIPTGHVGDARTPCLSYPDFVVVYKLGLFVTAPSYR